MAPVPAGAEIAVTGASGFIGSHIVAAALKAGYRVRAVVRDPNDETKTAHLKALDGAVDRLSFHAGDLLTSGSYDAALAGCAGVIHSAAVVEINNVKDPMKQIVSPSIDGVKNVLASADKAGGIKRFVQTSSIIATINYDSAADSTISEENWNEASTIDVGDPYGYAKTLAEREAHNHTGGGYDVVAINPAIVLGPCMCKAHTKASVVIIRQMLYGNAQPCYKSGFVDVRDVADAHIKALTLPETAGGHTPRRFILVSDDQMNITGLEAPLKKSFPDYQIDCVPKIGAAANVLLSIPLLWKIVCSPFEMGMLNNQFSYKNEKSKSELGIAYRSLEDTLRDSASSMIDPGHVKPRSKK